MKFKIGFLFLFTFLTGEAQEPVKPNKVQTFDTYEVQWIRPFPLKESQEKISFFDRAARIIFGRDNAPVITKPVAILAKSPNSFSILDQGSSTIFSVQDNESSVPKILRKKKLNLPSLVGLCAFSTNEILFTDSRLNKIFKLNEDQNTLTVLNNELILNRPTGIAYSTVSNEIWVVETGAHRISVLSEKGELLRTIGKRGTNPGEFNYPTDICIDKNGNVYVIDAMNFRIQIFDKTDKLISVFGEAGNATGYFASPKGIAVDSFGYIYVTDALFHTVQVFDISGKFLYRFGDQGRGDSQFWMPRGIYIDEKNYIYVADSYNSRIHLFQLINRKQN